MYVTFYRQVFMVDDFVKTVCPGQTELAPGRFACYVLCKIEWKGGVLSITGVEGPKGNGDCQGSCGQINMGYAHRDPADDDPRYTHLKRIYAFEPGWDEQRWFDFLDVWRDWHLNDMRAGCEHQRADQWHRRPVDPRLPLVQENMLAWKWPNEVPGGLLTAPCPVCGYEYGTKWLREEVPESVVQFLVQLPATRIIVPAAWA